MGRLVARLARHNLTDAAVIEHDLPAFDQAITQDQRALHDNCQRFNAPLPMRSMPKTARQM
jgi:hypothetical protein